MVLLALPLGCGRPAVAPNAPAEPAGPAPARVVLVGLDGLDWGLLDPCIAAGGCPTFARLKAAGAWAEMRSHPPVLSPLIWTSIATGRTPEVHGVLDFVVRDSATGRDVPISNRHRQVPAFWNLLSDAGRWVHVVNWWASHPAEPINGVMVTERPFYQLFGVAPQPPQASDVTPPDRLAEVARLRVPVTAVGWPELATLVALDEGAYDARIAAAETRANPYTEPLEHLRTIVATTRGVFAVARALAAGQPFDLLALYVEGTDTVGHRFAHYLPPRLPWVDPAEQQIFSATMRRYYELVDGELGRLIAAAPADTTWIIAADHGFQTGPARPSVPPDDFTSGAAEWHRMTGVLLAAGPGIRPGRLVRADIYDLCRTLLWLAEVPISDELEGRELAELMTPAWAAAHPPRRVASYADRPRPWLEGGVATTGIEASRLAELEALGYVDAAPAGPSAEGGDKATAELNLAKLAVKRGHPDQAVAHYRRAVELDDGFFYAMLELYGVYHGAGDHDQALYWLARAMQTQDPALPARVPVVFVRAALAADRLPGAQQVLESMPAGWQRRASYHAAWGIVALAQDRDAAARAAFERALAIDPGDMDALDGLMELAAAGADIDWKAAVDAAFQRVVNDLGGLRQLARVCARHGQHAAAARCLERLLASDPSDEDARTAIAAARTAMGAPS